jgi:hypothetical protein
LDDGRTDDVVATFCRDGVCDIPGMGTHEGHDALREAYSRLKLQRPQRHLVVNTLVTDWDDHEANAIKRRHLPLAGRLRLGDPTRGPIPGHPPPRRRRVAVPPPGGRVRDLSAQAKASPAAAATR